MYSSILYLRFSDNTFINKLYTEKAPMCSAFLLKTRDYLPKYSHKKFKSLNQSVLFQCKIFKHFSCIMFKKMVDLDLYVWVVSGSQRTAVVRVLTHAMTPTQTFKKAKEINPRMSLNSTSDVLRLLVKKGLAKCLNPMSKRGRIYELTEAGLEIQKGLLQT